MNSPNRTPGLAPKAFGLRCSLDFSRNDRLTKVSYEHTRTYRNHLDRQRVPVPWAGLELPRYPRPNRERDVFDAFPCAMDCLRAAGRKRDPGLILVLEHRRQRDRSEEHTSELQSRF